jgi:elongation factor G
LYNRSLKARNELIEKLSEYDDELADLYLAGSPISAEQLKASIKKVICDPKHLSKVCAVMLGASVRNRGVQSLLDGIISYLPSPT